MDWSNQVEERGRRKAKVEEDVKEIVERGWMESRLRIQRKVVEIIGDVKVIMKENREKLANKQEVSESENSL